MKKIVSLLTMLSIGFSMHGFFEELGAKLRGGAAVKEEAGSVKETAAVSTSKGITTAASITPRDAGLAASKNIQSLYENQKEGIQRQMEQLQQDLAVYEKNGYPPQTLANLKIYTASLLTSYAQLLFAGDLLYKDLAEDSGLRAELYAIKKLAPSIQKKNFASRIAQINERMAMLTSQIREKQETVLEINNAMYQDKVRIKNELALVPINTRQAEIEAAQKTQNIHINDLDNKIEKITPGGPEQTEYYRTLLIAARDNALAYRAALADENNLWEQLKNAQDIINSPAGKAMPAEAKLKPGGALKAVVSEDQKKAAAESIGQLQEKIKAAQATQSRVFEKLTEAEKALQEAEGIKEGKGKEKTEVRPVGEQKPVSTAKPVAVTAYEPMFKPKPASASTPKKVEEPVLTGSAVQITALEKQWEENLTNVRKYRKTLEVLEQQMNNLRKEKGAKENQSKSKQASIDRQLTDIQTRYDGFMESLKDSGESLAKNFKDLKTQYALTGKSIVPLEKPLDKARHYLTIAGVEVPETTLSEALSNFNLAKESLSEITQKIEADTDDIAQLQAEIKKLSQEKEELQNQAGPRLAALQNQDQLATATYKANVKVKKLIEEKEALQNQIGEHFKALENRYQLAQDAYRASGFDTSTLDNTFNKLKNNLENRRPTQVATSAAREKKQVRFAQQEGAPAETALSGIISPGLEELEQSLVLEAASSTQNAALRTAALNYDDALKQLTDLQKDKEAMSTSATVKPEFLEQQKARVAAQAQKVAELSQIYERAKTEYAKSPSKLPERPLVPVKAKAELTTMILPQAPQATVSKPALKVPQVISSPLPPVVAAKAEAAKGALAQSAISYQEVQNKLRDLKAGESVTQVLPVIAQEKEDVRVQMRNLDKQIEVQIKASKSPQALKEEWGKANKYYVQLGDMQKLLKDLDAGRKKVVALQTGAQKDTKDTQEAIKTLQKQIGKQEKAVKKAAIVLSKTKSPLKESAVVAQRKGLSESSQIFPPLPATANVAAAAAKPELAAAPVSSLPAPPAKATTSPPLPPSNLNLVQTIAEPKAEVESTEAVAEPVKIAAKPAGPPPPPPAAAAPASALSSTKSASVQTIKAPPSTALSKSLALPTAPPSLAAPVKESLASKLFGKVFKGSSVKSEKPAGSQEIAKAAVPLKAVSKKDARTIAKNLVTTALAQEKSLQEAAKDKTEEIQSNLEIARAAAQKLITPEEFEKLGESYERLSGAVAKYETAKAQATFSEKLKTDLQNSAKNYSNPELILQEATNALASANYPDIDSMVAIDQKNLEQAQSAVKLATAETKGAALDLPAAVPQVWSPGEELPPPPPAKVAAKIAEVSETLPERSTEPVPSLPAAVPPLSPVAAAPQPEGLPAPPAGFAAPPPLPVEVAEKLPELPANIGTPPPPPTIGAPPPPPSMVLAAAQDSLKQLRDRAGELDSILTQWKSRLREATNTPENKEYRDQVEATINFASKYQKYLIDTQSGFNPENAGQINNQMRQWDTLLASQITQANALAPAAEKTKTITGMTSIREKKPATLPPPPPMEVQAATAPVLPPPSPSVVAKKGVAEKLKSLFESSEEAKTRKEAEQARAARLQGTPLANQVAASKKIIQDTVAPTLKYFDQKIDQDTLSIETKIKLLSNDLNALQTMKGPAIDQIRANTQALIKLYKGMLPVEKEYTKIVKGIKESQATFNEIDRIKKADPELYQTMSRYFPTLEELKRSIARDDEQGVITRGVVEKILQDINKVSAENNALIKENDIKIGAQAAPQAAVAGGTSPVHSTLPEPITPRSATEFIPMTVNELKGWIGAWEKQSAELDSKVKNYQAQEAENLQRVSLESPAYLDQLQTIITAAKQYKEQVDAYASKLQQTLNESAGATEIPAIQGLALREQAANLKNLGNVLAKKEADLTQEAAISVGKVGGPAAPVRAAEKVTTALAQPAPVVRPTNEGEINYQQVRSKLRTLQPGEEVASAIPLIDKEAKEINNQMHALDPQIIVLKKKAKNKDETEYLKRLQAERNAIIPYYNQLTTMQGLLKGLDDNNKALASIEAKRARSAVHELAIEDLQKDINQQEKKVKQAAFALSDWQSRFDERVNAVVEQKALLTQKEAEVPSTPVLAAKASPQESRVSSLFSNIRPSKKKAVFEEPTTVVAAAPVTAAAEIPSAKVAPELPALAPAVKTVRGLPEPEGEISYQQVRSKLRTLQPNESVEGIIPVVAQEEQAVNAEIMALDRKLTIPKGVILTKDENQYLKLLKAQRNAAATYHQQLASMHTLLTRLNGDRKQLAAGELKDVTEIKALQKKITQEVRDVRGYANASLSDAQFLYKQANTAVAQREAMGKGLEEKIARSEAEKAAPGIPASTAPAAKIADQLKVALTDKVDAAAAAAATEVKAMNAGIGAANKTLDSVRAPSIAPPLAAAAAAVGAAQVDEATATATLKAMNEIDLTGKKLTATNPPAAKALDTAVAGTKIDPKAKPAVEKKLANAKKKKASTLATLKGKVGDLRDWLGTRWPVLAGVAAAIVLIPVIGVVLFETLAPSHAKHPAPDMAFFIERLNSAGVNLSQIPYNQLESAYDAVLAAGYNINSITDQDLLRVTGFGVIAPWQQPWQGQGQWQGANVQ